MVTMTATTQLSAWKALQAHYQQVRQVHLRELFSQDPSRGERLCAEGAGVFLDYSKNRITDETLRLLLDLANEVGLRQQRRSARGRPGITSGIRS